MEPESQCHVEMEVGRQNKSRANEQEKIVKKKFQYPGRKGTTELGKQKLFSLNCVPSVPLHLNFMCKDAGVYLRIHMYIHVCIMSA